MTSKHPKFDKISKFLSQNYFQIGYECKDDLANIKMLDIFRGK